MSGGGLIHDQMKTRPKLGGSPWTGWEACTQSRLFGIKPSLVDIGISTITEACSTSLRTLKLLDCYKLGDKSILAVANLCKNLETLVIGGCRDLSSE